MSGHLSAADNSLVSIDVAGQIASSGINGTVIDMSGWSGCLFIFNLGTMVAGATFDARVMQSNTSAFTVNSNVTNAALVQVANTANANVFMIDVWRPGLQFLKTVTTPATANTTFASVAVRYGRTGSRPPTQTASQVVRVQAN